VGLTVVPVAAASPSDPAVVSAIGVPAGADPPDADYPLKSLLPMLLLPLRSQRLAFRLPLPTPRQTI
jgi:hypothetical protein